MRASAVIHELGLAAGHLCVLRLVFLVVILEVLGIIRGSISLLEAFGVDSALSEILLVLIRMRHHEVLLET